MKTTTLTSIGICAYSIEDIRPVDMDAMIEAREILRANLRNHKSNNKKEYLSDEQLTQMFRILVILTKDCEHRSTSSFKEVDVEKELNELQENDDKPSFQLLRRG